MNQLSLKDYQLKFKTLGKLPIILEESVAVTSNYITTCNWVDWKTLRL